MYIETGEPPRMVKTDHAGDLMPQEYLDGGFDKHVLVTTTDHS